MNKLLGDFRPVTEHFGVRHEIYWGQEVYVIYQNIYAHRPHEVTARRSFHLAVKECHYLERLNFSR